MVTKTVDRRGRLSLGKSFADRLVIVEELPGGSLQITPAEAVPAREVWLYRNPKALASVMRGLDESKRGEAAEAPDLDADNDWADAAD